MRRSRSGRPSVSVAALSADYPGEAREKPRGAGMLPLVLPAVRRGDSIMMPVMLAAALLAALAVTGSAAAANPIQVENARAGAFGWRGAEVNGAEIQGYTSEISALPRGA